MKLEDFEDGRKETMLQRAARIWRRSKDEVLLNAPVYVVVGGLCPERPDTAKKVAIREPSNNRFKEHAMMVFDAMKGMLSEHWDWVQKLWQHPESFGMADIYRFTPLVCAVEELVADIVGESVEFVQEDMGPEQTSLVLTAYIRSLGLRRMRELFQTARLEWEVAGEMLPGQQAPRPQPQAAPQEPQPAAMAAAMAAGPGGQSASEPGKPRPQPSTESQRTTIRLDGIRGQS